jgi:phosphomannomutase
MERFGTAGIRGSTRETVTPSLATAVGRAVGTDAETVVLGRDGRTTSPALADALAAGIAAGGGTVVRLGQVPTPAVGFASRGRHGAMITASHNPPSDNGIKLFTDGEPLDREGERVIERRLEAGAPPLSWDEWGSRRRESVLPAYREAVVSYARGPESTETPPSGRVVVDCGNGVAALATPTVLRSLGASVTTLNDNVDGHFPGRASKPTAESLSDLRSFVAEDTDAAFGIGHDGDADRIVIVDAAGEVVHEDTILAILAEHAVSETDVADPVVITTPNASARVDERVTAAGGRVERTPLGRLGAGVQAADGSVVFAGEPWKHRHPGLGPWIDGVASAAVLAQLVGAAGGLATLCDPVSERPYVKRNVECPDERKDVAMDAVQRALPEQYPDATVETNGGVRLQWPDRSWALVRPSGTEAYLRVYVEAGDAPDRAEEIVEAVSGLVASVEDS